MPFDETQFTTRAYRIVEQHAANAGVDTKDARHEAMSSWGLFSSYLKNVTFSLLDRDEPPSWVAILFAKLGAYIAANAGEYSDYYLGMMLMPYYPYVSFTRHGIGLSEGRYARLRGHVGVPLAAAEGIILQKFADDEWRENQMGY